MPTQENINTYVFLSIFFPRWALNTEFASIVCNSKQGDLICSAGQHRNWSQPQLTQEKLGRGWIKMQVNGPRV